MSVYDDKRNTIQDNLYALYDVYNQYKLLYAFYQGHRIIKSKEDIKNRMDYILKNKIKQRTEYEALLWVLGEDTNEETNN